MKKIYLDNSASTPVDKKVVMVMKKYWNESFANPSSIHKMGVEAKVVVEKARKEIAGFLNAHAREIIITSGGTEANNLAIFGILEGNKKGHFITTEIEHSSILECFKELEKRGNEISYLKVDESGLVNPKDLREMIKPETVLISIGYANGEIGVIQQIKEIAKEIRHARKNFMSMMPYFHIDASQAGQYLNMNVEQLGVDMVTLDAQKMYGPKGIGALFIKDGIKIEPIIFGGGQEGGRRSGTENVPLIVGFAKAVEISEKMKEKEGERVAKLRNEFFDGVKKFVPRAVVNGSLTERLPNNINISIPGEDGELLVLRLDEIGIICSSASACASGEGESYVVRKISIENPDEKATSTLRFSLGRDTKKSDINYLLKKLKELI